MEKKHLYTQLRCPNDKTPREKNFLTAGKAYTTGGLTVRFDQPAKRHDIVQDVEAGKTQVQTTNDAGTNQQSRGRPTDRHAQGIRVPSGTEQAGT